MGTRRIATRIIALLFFIAFAVIMGACDTWEGKIQGSNSIAMANWNWAQILISLGLGILLGFVLGLAVSKKK